MIVRNARKKNFQLEPLERRELLSYFVDFGTSFMEGSEAQTVVNVPVTSVGHWDSPRPVTVNYAVVQQVPFYSGVDPFLYNAKAGVDYSLEGGSTEGGSITFQPGQTQQNITIHVTDDNILKPMEAIKLVLTTSPDHDVDIRTPNMFTYAIYDNDATSLLPLATPEVIGAYLVQKAFWQAKDFDMSQDNGDVWVFTNKATGQILGGAATFQGNLIPVQDGVKGQAAPFTWSIHQKTLTAGDSSAQQLAVTIATGDQTIDFFDLVASSNDRDEVVQFVGLPYNSTDYSGRKTGFWYTLDSAQVAAAIRMPFQLNLVPIGNQAVNAGGVLTLTAQPAGGAAGDPHTFSLDGTVPPGATIDPNTGAFTWAVPATQAPGQYPVTIDVTDTETMISTSTTFTITVSGGTTQPPGTQPPGTQPPGTQPPGTQPPNTQPPNNQIPNNPVVTLAGGSVVKAKKGMSQIVVTFNEARVGAAALPVSAFQLATIPKGKKARPKPIRLVSASYNPNAHTVTLIPQGKLNFNTPLKLWISGLSEGPATLILSKHGARITVVPQS
jgi:hypothetical protein